ncbi:MAG: metabolite traffic protein EboE [Chitinophagaceae bacterium]|nr:metabolite traffic protein EboE [Chitinophagaceae bacterium]
MVTSQGHLTYCSNIHAGESWKAHFLQLQEHVPAIKKEVAPNQSFGIGLRLSAEASLELIKPKNLEAFRQWLNENDCYVFTMNGFPYGGFHHTIVKDKVHAPDWTTAERTQYTIRLVQILAELLPAKMDGGISTSPLTYRYWHNDSELPKVFETATANLLQVVDLLIQVKQATGKVIHIDIEPEPDGLLGDGKEFLEWYTRWLLPKGTDYLKKTYSISAPMAEEHMKEHIRVCYDVCHFAVSYEDHVEMIAKLKELGIQTGKIQISAALRADMSADLAKRAATVEAFSQFNESTYLHQVVARTNEGSLIRYKDMPEAIQDAYAPPVTEWRAHFHVPVFIYEYGELQSTQKDIIQVLQVQKKSPFTHHLEIETYTWEVLPEEIRLPQTKSIIREMKWVLEKIADS